MSIRMMNDVWKYAPAKGSELLLLLAIADFADDDGGNAWPSMATLAKKTRLGERNVRYIVKELEDRGILEVKYNKGRNNTNRYQIILDRDDEIGYPSQCAGCGDSAVTLHHIKPRTVGGDDSHANLMPLCLDCHNDAHRPGWLSRARKGEKIYPQSLQVLSEGVQSAASEGAKDRTKGVQSAAPDPSFNHQQPLEDVSTNKIVHPAPSSLERLRSAVKPAGLGRR